MGVHRRGNVWVIEWVDAAGRRRRKTTTATTKAGALTLLHEVEAREERIAHGLEIREKNPGAWTLTDLVKWWLKDHVPTTPSGDITRAVMAKHWINTPLGADPLDRITTAALERALTAKKGISANTVNHLRAYLSSAYSKAIRSGHWLGDNPVTLVTRRKVTRTMPTTLTIDEARGLLEVTDVPWRDVFAVALYAGLRLGEILGLQVEDAQIGQRVLMVHRSHGQATTKGGRGRLVPIHPELVPYLQAAVDRAGKGPWLFPSPKGGRRPENTHAAGVLRRRLAAAGITRHVRFHDLRHTCASLLLEAGVDMHALKDILGHSTITLTVDTYGHLQRRYLAGQMDRLSLAAKDVEPRALPPAGDGQKDPS